MTSLPQNQTNSNEDVEKEKGEMSILDHLRELRLRLFISVIAICLGAILAYSFSTEAFDVLTRPYFIAFPGEKLIGTGPAEAFTLKLTVAFFLGILLASPILFHQLWKFIAPGMHENEKKMLVPFVACTTLLFFAGVSFAYYVIFPFVFEFFHEQYASIAISPTIKMSEHLSLMIQGLVAFGAVFELPMIAFFLGRLGVIDDVFLIKGTRHAIVIIFVVSAVLTPPDVLTQFLMAGPLLILYGFSILVVRYTKPKQTEESTES